MALNQLLQTGLAVGIGVAAIGGAVLAYQELKTGSKATDESIFLIQSVEKVRSYLSNDTDATNATNDVITGTEMIPRQRFAGNVINHPWGGAITITPETLVSANDSFKISYSPLPDKKSCNEFVSKVIENTSQTSVNGTVVKAYGAQTDTAALSGGGACGATPQGDIEFVFSLRG